MSDKAKMLERVRALLAKAASTEFPAEADTFREKADQIMTAYAIEQWQVDAAQKGVGARQMPIRRDFDYNWARGNPFREQLWQMFYAVARHCRVVAVNQKADYRTGMMPAIGLESDLDWFDLLFTNLQIAMIQKVDPQPSPELGLNENLAMMREAGMPWEPAINRIIKLGRMQDYDVPEGARFDDVYKPWVHGYRAWCRKTGYKQSYVNQNTFRRNFANGFAAEIGDRLYRMRRESERAYDSSHTTGSMALAVRDIMTQVREAVFIEFPDLRPHPVNCPCDVCTASRKRLEEAMKKPVRTRRSAIPRERIDYAAVEAGRAAGRDVSLSNSPSERLGNRKQIEQ
jgi:hypothetical protein